MNAISVTKSIKFIRTTTGRLPLFLVLFFLFVNGVTSKTRVCPKSPRARARRGLKGDASYGRICGVAALRISNRFQSPRLEDSPAHFPEPRNSVRAAA